MTMAAPTTSGAGYSGTPLAKKLGYKEGSRVFRLNAPAHYAELVSPLPAGVRFDDKAGPAVDIAHIFVTKTEDMRKALEALRAKLNPEASIWVSWPKKSSKVPTDILEDTIREVALPMGLVDVKVCAVDEVWSGLKLVVRKALR